MCGVAIIIKQISRLQDSKQVPGFPVRGGAGPLAVRRGGVARELRALQVRPQQVHGHQCSALRPLCKYILKVASDNGVDRVYVRNDP